MKICVFGIARSGTTAIYSLIQDMLIHNEHVQPSFKYEPFLWDEAIFDMAYQDIKPQLFYLIDSISVEGLYHHLQTPLFCEDSNHPATLSYLQRILTPRASDNAVLAKFVRANGRYKLLKKACPDCKFVFVIRNPIDTVNSIINKFSNFGRGYHKSDYSRFIDEINQIYSLQINAEEIHSEVARSALYWRAMNQYALDSFASEENPPLVIALEQYHVKPESTIRALCEHLQLPYQAEFVQRSSGKVGPVTNTVNITEHDYQILEQLQPLYLEMLKKNNFTNADELLANMPAKYGGKFLAERPEPDRNPHLNADYLGKIYAALLQRTAQ